MSEKKVCFVVSPIGSEGSDTRERSDKLLKFVISKAIESYGYEAIRADDIAEPGLITSQVIENVVESPLVIADMTNSNANVFYEIAIRHAVKEPIIQLIDSDESIPFDVAGTRTIQIDLEDIESIEKAKSQIQGQIESIEEGDNHSENPISVALDLKRLRESSDPSDRSMADIMETLSELRTEVISLEERLNDPENILPDEHLNKLIQHQGIRRTEELRTDLKYLKSRIDSTKQKLSKNGLDSEYEREIFNDLDQLEAISRRINEEIEGGRTTSGLSDFV